MKIDLKILRSIVLLGMILFSGVQLLSQTYTVSGYIVDAVSKETLIGATAMQNKGGRGVVSDMNGFFQITGLPSGKHTLVFSHIGYLPIEISVEIFDKGKLLSAIELQPNKVELQEVSIVAVRPDVIGDREAETSIHELSAKTIQSIPAAGNDIFSAVKFLPGVDRTEPYSPLFSVRGGDPGENAVLLDGVMIYNPYHSSITSGIFNTQTIKTVDLLVGGFGAEYGGRNSSVMYITTKDGNREGVHGEIEPSTFHSKAFVEFPVGKRGSAMLAGRYYYDIFSEFIMQNHSYFYDFNLSYTLRINERNRLSFKYFQSHDNTGLNFNTFYRYIGNTFEDLDFYKDFDLSLTNQWQNRASTLIHKWVVGPRVFLRSQVYYSSHTSDNNSSTNFFFKAFDEVTQDTVRVALITASNFSSHITDVQIKTELNIKIGRFNTLQIGGSGNVFDFRNTASINYIEQGALSQSPVQLTAYTEDKIQLWRILVRPGIRITQYDKQPFYYEPRINMELNLSDGMHLRAAWGTYYQSVISMNTNEVEMSQSVDYYYPLKNYSPSKSVHYIAGLDKDFSSIGTLSLDFYYKDISRLYTFDINQTSSTVLTLSDKLQNGSGMAYGAECMFRGDFKNLSGWLSYGLSWATRSYPFINDGANYPYDYNNRHTIKAVVNYAITRNIDYNASFIFLSGTYRSVEQTMQSYYYFDPVSNQISFFPMWISNAKNNAKMPARINLDMSIRKRLRGGFGRNLADALKLSESYVTVTVRNILFMYRNIDYYFPVGGSLNRFKGKYIPFGSNYIPSVGISYTLKF